MHLPASLQRMTRSVRCGVVAITACLIAATASAQSPIRNIDVTYEGDTYVVKAEMFAPVLPTIAWDVLTDFSHMAGWVPNVKESTIVKQDGQQLTIEQRGTAKFGALSIPYTSVREIVMDPQTTIRSTQVKGSMRRLQSLMTLSADRDGTKMLYQLEMVPSFLASGVVSKDFLKHEIEEQFTAIVGEMIKRKK